jgi:DNA-binding CsgD family transcriptional regulator
LERRRKPPHPVDAISPREREVLALVAEGRTNKAIAEALFDSPNTVKIHVASLLHERQADTHSQLVVMATRQLLPQAMAKTDSGCDVTETFERNDVGRICAIEHPEGRNVAWSGR